MSLEEDGTVQVPTVGYHFSGQSLLVQRWEQMLYQLQWCSLEIVNVVHPHALMQLGTSHPLVRP